MNLKFWNKKKDVEETEVTEAPEVSGPLARIKALAASLTARFKSPPPFTAEVPASTEQESPATEEASPGSETAAEHPGALARLKALFQKPAATLEEGESGEAPPVWRVNLIVVAVLLLLLLLGAFGYAVWSIVRSAPDPETDVTELITDRQKPLPITMPASVPVAASDAMAASAPGETDAVSAVPAAEIQAAASSVKAASQPPETELEALRRKNAELQAQIDAMKKAQQPGAASVRFYPGKDSRSTAGGIATVGNSDPKAATATLKEAIETMNAGTGDYRKPPAK